MKKADILASLTSAGLTEDLIQTVQAELATYPDELTVEQLKQFDTFLASLQVSELEEAHQLEQLADLIEDTSRQLDSSFENFTFQSVRAMKTGLSQVQEVAAADADIDVNTDAPPVQ